MYKGTRRTRLTVFVLSSILWGLLLPSVGFGSQQAKSYPDGRGGKVYLPLGDLSFADEVVSYTPGSPSAEDQHSIANEALLPPDYIDSVDDHYLTLGCGGELIVRFTDNVLGDVEGPDIFIFEIGQAVEATELAVSRDGKTWIDVGRIAGAVASIDIKGRIESGDTFRYLKLTDGKTACFGQWPGADIDAIAAIGAGRRVVLESSVLFDVDASQLKPEATAVLEELAEEINGYGQAKIVLEGHTDSSGATAHNQQLSEARAAAVGRFLVKNGVAASAINTLGKGESQPITPNDTEENRARNRRVEALIFAR